VTDLLNGLVPVFALILLGNVLKRRQMIDPGFWAGGERLGYFLLLPALVFLHLTDADLDPGSFGAITLATVIPPLVNFVGLLLLRPVMGPYAGRHGPAFTSLIQGTIRSNFFIALAAAPTLLGPDGVTALVVALALYPALVNVLSVGVLARFGSAAETAGGSLGARAVALQILRNPFIIVVAAGMAANFVGLRLPTVLHATLDLMGGIALPLALLCIGAGLRFEAVKTGRRAIQTAILVKLMITPAVAFLAAWALGLGPVETAAVVLFHCQPTAITSYMLAKQMGGDHELMAAIITIQTCVAALTIPCVMLLVLAGG